MERLPRYILHQELGAGGMGVVHLGTWVSPAGERRVAIKQLAGRGRIDEQGRARLVAEAKLVFRLTHTNVCQVLDLGENERGTFVVMEYVPGLDLRALLAELRADGLHLDVASAVYIAREVARALDYAHRRGDDAGRPLGLVHGDVTPQNILLSDEGEVKLTDFGIARALGTAAPGAGLVAGTPGYVAPELRHGGGDHRGDIFALGVTLLVALTGDGVAESLAQLERLTEVRPDVSAALVAIIRRAVAADPAARHVAANEVERELSLELARRFPAFTPSLLAEVVRAHRQRTAGDARAGGGGETLTSLTAGGDTVTDVEVAPAREAGLPSMGQTQTAAVTPARGARIALVALGVLGLLAAGGAIAYRRWRHDQSSRSTAAATSRPAGAVAIAPVATPSVATPPVATPPVATPPVATPPVATPPPVVASQAHRASTHDPARRAHATADAAAAYLTVNAKPWGAVLVDGKKIADETPLYRYRLPPGDHVVRIRFGAGGLSRPERVRLVAGETRTLGFAP